MQRTCTWQGWDDPQLRNTATISLHDDHLSATGMQTGRDYSAAWSLTTTHGWITECITVVVQGAQWTRSLRLERSPAGIWSDEASTTGTQPTGWPAPGIAPDTDLSKALDCDLGLCPVTNTMPILRLDLMRQQAARTPLIMAWIDMPTLRVIASDQYYASVDAGSVSYASGTRDVEVTLGVDSDGIVIDYPELARRVRS